MFPTTRQVTGPAMTGVVLAACLLVCVWAYPTAGSAPASNSPASPQPALATADPAQPEVAGVPVGEIPVRESWLTADRELSPLLQAVKSAWLEYTAAAAQLETDLAAAGDATAALAVQRRIEDAAREFELRILRIQIDDARRNGRIAVAEQLEAAVETMLNPPAFPARPERPAPAGER
ncbi:MAG: hypothetical protein PHQ53_00550 [Candidatus Krumholzibacteria bacterium]|nr:hypothetical protein [Candidatus Krumholzibacteria bacterium]